MILRIIEGVKVGSIVAIFGFETPKMPKDELLLRVRGGKKLLCEASLQTPLLHSGRFPHTFVSVFGLGRAIILLLQEGYLQPVLF